MHVKYANKVMLLVGLNTFRSGLTFLFKEPSMFMSYMYIFSFADQNPKSQSIKTLIWCVLVRIVSGSTPTTFACQLSLPRLPVPSVDATLKKFLESVRPLFSEEENERLEKEAEVCWNQLSSVRCL